MEKQKNNQNISNDAITCKDNDINIITNEHTCDNANKLDVNDNIDTVNIIDHLKEKNKNLVSEVEVLSDHIKNIEDRNLRLCAEMENVRRRSQKDIENIHKFGLEKFTRSILPVLDGIEKAIEVSRYSDNVKDISEGIKLTMKMLIDIMKKFGINKIYPQGELLDPNKHEAMATQINSEMKDNQILSVLQAGYELNNRVIRPARVLVVKNS